MSLVSFVALCGAVAILRLCELQWSRQHERQLIHRGGAVVAEPVYRPMVLLHAGLLVCAPMEAAFWHRPPPMWLSVLALGILLGAFCVRSWALFSLGGAWSVRVTDDPRRTVVIRGPYRYIRHPNYVAVILEVAALPLCGGAYLTAFLATLGNAYLLRRRIALEEQVLFRTPAYRAAFGDRPRFIPRFSRG